MKGYRLWCSNPKSPKFIISRDVTFDELSMLSSKEESTSCTNDSTQKQVELEIGSSDSF